MADDSGCSTSIYSKGGSLTEIGTAQAKRARAMIDDLSTRTGLKLELSVTSPLVRCIQTAKIATEGLEIPLIVTPLHSERICEPCDTGDKKCELQARFPELDFGALEKEEWWAAEEAELYKNGLYDGLLASVQRRARKFSQWIQARPEETVLVFGHYGLFSVLLGLRMERCEVYDVQWPPPSIPVPLTHSRLMKFDTFTRTGRPTLLAPRNAMQPKKQNNMGVPF
jgi:broad specificity phosphatase PhoE